MSTNGKIIKLRIILFCVLLCLLCCHCVRQEEQPQEGGFTSDFAVKPCWENKSLFTEEDEAAAAKQIRQFVRLACPEQINETDKFYLSQPYPLLNLGSKKYDVFLFKEERCIGIMSLSKINGEYTGSFSGPLAEEDFPELTEWLSEEKAFVLLTDGMRLWLVSEKESFSWNLKDLQGPAVTWKEEYAPYGQALRLTEIGFSD